MTFTCCKNGVLPDCALMISMPLTSCWLRPRRLFCSSSLEPLNRWFFPLLSDILIANGDLSKIETNVFLYIQMATTWMKAGEIKISWFYFEWRNDEKAGSILAPNFVFQTKSELSLRRVSYLKMNLKKKHIYIFKLCRLLMTIQFVWYIYSIKLAYLLSIVGIYGNNDSVEKMKSAFRILLPQKKQCSYQIWIS